MKACDSSLLFAICDTERMPGGIPTDNLLGVSDHIHTPQICTSDSNKRNQIEVQRLGCNLFVTL